LQGRLGRLGNIPDKYDIAVSTACGALNNIAIQSPKVNHASSSCKSRPSDTRLEKLSTDTFNERAVTLEGVPRLFDLIMPNDPRFAPAFYKGFG
jgi:structural maintenance of chromosome 4